MMMPANFSAIAENELTYVVGGSAVTDFAKKLNTNIVTTVGNTYMEKLISTTLGVMFGGVWNSDNSIASAMSNAFFKVGGKDVNAFNGALQVLGIGAAVYNLGTADVVNTLGDDHNYKDSDDKKRNHFFNVNGELFSKAFPTKLFGKQ